MEECSSKLISHVCAFARRVEQFVQIMIKTFVHLKTNVVQPIWLLKHNHGEQFCPFCFEILKTIVVHSILLLSISTFANVKINIVHPTL